MTYFVAIILVCFQHVCVLEQPTAKFPDAAACENLVASTWAADPQVDGAHSFCREIREP